MRFAFPPYFTEQRPITGGTGFHPALAQVETR
jgi:hypothetical protein